MRYQTFVQFFAFVLILVFVCVSAQAQTTSFVFQGKLTDNSAAANGTYQFEFKLFDAASGGQQIGQAISNLPATVSNGIFAVNLDFGANSFDGAARFLEIGVRQNGSQQPYTVLNPRQPVASTPYAVKSLNADKATTAITATNSTQLGGIPAAQYVQTTDARMSDSRDPKPGSGNYIQNTANLQSGAANFNISGEGKADKLTAATQFNLGADRILSAPGNGNLFAGISAGSAATANGTNNSFFGNNAGKSNTDGDGNAFFGRNSGFGNTTGSGNAFFGSGAGQSNLSGGSNSFFGESAGLLNTTGFFNVFIGKASAFSNSTGSNNTFVGYNAGSSVTTGNENVFIGSNAGSTGNVFNSIAIGSNVKVAASNTAQIGSANMTVKMPGEVEIGKSLNVTGGVNAGELSTFAKSVDINGSLKVKFHLGGDTFDLGKGHADQITTGHITSITGIYTGLLNAAKIKIHPNNSTSGFVDTACIAEEDNTLRPCFLLFTDMQNVEEFKGGAEIIKNLRPVTFSEAGNSERSVGLMSVDSNFADSMFVKRDQNNRVAGVRQHQLIPALVSAAQEQQKQIERQAEQIKQQQAQIEALKALVCQSNSNAAVCQPNK